MPETTPTTPAAATTATPASPPAKASPTPDTPAKKSVLDEVAAFAKEADARGSHPRSVDKKGRPVAAPHPDNSPAWWAKKKGTAAHLFAGAHHLAGWPTDPGHPPPTLTEAEFDAAIAGVSNIRLG